MKVYFTKTLIEGKGYSTCNVKLSSDLEQLKNYAQQVVDFYVDAGGFIEKKTDLKYVVVDNDLKVTITIENQEI